MKKRSKVLIVGLLVLALALPLSSCNAKWDEVTDFLSGIYTTTNGWEGVSYEYELKDVDVYSYIDDNGKTKTWNDATSYTKSSVYKLDKNGEATGYVTTKGSSTIITNTGTGPIKSGFIKTTDYRYYDGSSNTEYRKQISTDKRDGETTKETFYNAVAGFSGEAISDASSEISYCIRRATNYTSSSLGVVSASVSGKSASWTMKDGNEETTVTIKTDGKYVVNYLCIEEKCEFSDGSKYSIKETYKRIGGGTVTQPSWVSKNLSQFDDGGENENTKGTVTISIDSAATVVAGETLELPYTVDPKKAEVSAASSNEAVVSASTQGGVLNLKGVAEGSATVTLVGTCKEYADANVNISVSVVTNPMV